MLLLSAAIFPVKSSHIILHFHRDPEHSWKIDGFSISFLIKFSFYSKLFQPKISVMPLFRKSCDSAIEAGKNADPKQLGFIQRLINFRFLSQKGKKKKNTSSVHNHSLQPYPLQETDNSTTVHIQPE